MTAAADPPGSPSAPDLLLVSEAAVIFRVSPATVRRWVRDGLLTGIRTPGGRALRVHAAAVREIIISKEDA